MKRKIGRRKHRPTAPPPTPNEPTLVDEEGDLQKEIQVLTLRIKRAQHRKELATLESEVSDILDKSPTLEVMSPEDDAEIFAIKDALKKEFPRRLRDHGQLHILGDEIDEFVENYVDDNYNNYLSHCCSLTYNQDTPPSVMSHALRAWYMERTLLEEDEVAILEEQKGDRLWFRDCIRNLFKGSHEYKSWKARYKKVQHTKAARERRAQQRAFVVQRLYTTIHPWFTFFSFVFMVGMMIVAAHQLGYAVSLATHTDKQYVSISKAVVEWPLSAAEKFFGVQTEGPEHPTADGHTVNNHSPENGNTPSLAATDSEPPASLSAAGLEDGPSNRNGEPSQKTTDSGAPESKAATTHLHGSSGAMERTLHALEIILVAPLPYLLLLGLGRYIKALAYQEEVAEYRAELLDFKAFEVALFIAIIAAAVVGRALGADGGLTLQFAIAAATVIAILAAYYWILEKSGEEAGKEHQEEEDRQRRAERRMIRARGPRH